jgi:hypothetical protein
MAGGAGYCILGSPSKVIGADSFAYAADLIFKAHQPLVPCACPFYFIRGLRKCTYFLALMAPMTIFAHFALTTSLSKQHHRLFYLSSVEQKPIPLNEMGL